MSEIDHKRPELLLKDAILRLRNATLQNEQSVTESLEPHHTDYRSPPSTIPDPSLQIRVDVERLTQSFRLFSASLSAAERVKANKNEGKPTGKKYLNSASSFEKNKEDVLEELGPVLSDAFLFLFSEQQRGSSACVDWLNHWTKYVVVTYGQRALFNRSYELLFDIHINDVLNKFSEPKKNTIKKTP
jgi:hypothetical protein